MRNTAKPKIINPTIKAKMKPSVLHSITPNSATRTNRIENKKRALMSFIYFAKSLIMNYNEHTSYFKGMQSCR